MRSLSGETSFYETVISTFLASVKSVGTACTLAGIGIYLHQCGFVVGNGKRTLALISQQVTIPLLFFTKILYCNQDWSSDPCPNVTDSLGDAWILLVWPIWVCGSGLFVGYIVTIVADVPKHQRNSIMASIAFGNSTGLPITLLTVIHSNFGSSSVLGSVDPTLFLSVYLVMYPVLQWGIGGMLLAPPSTPSSKKRKSSLVKTTKSVTETEASNGDDDGDDGDEDEMEDGSSIGMKRQLSMKSSIRNSLARNVINRKKNEKYLISHRGLESVDASMYISIQENLNRWGKPVYGTAKGSFDGSLDGLITEQNEEGMNMNMRTRTESGADIGMDLSEHDQHSHDNNDINSISIDENDNEDEQESSALLTTTTSGTGTTTSGISTSRTLISSRDKVESKEKLLDTIRMVFKRCFQPPVIAALLGLLFASFPRLRGILVDIDDRNGTAPFQWFFDGLCEIGRSAVPINMMILGCNLSASYMLEQPNYNSSQELTATTDNHHSDKFFSNKASLYVVIGKMIIMPILGVISTLLLQTVYSVPEEIAGGLYLVLLIVFLCPTANNVMVMVELSGNGGSKEGMARIIAYQYAVAPIVLSGTVTGSVLMASYMAQTSTDNMMMSST
jgi:predicted permease